MSTPATALIVFAHGSSVESANEAVRTVCSAMAEAGGRPVQAAFLDCGHPGLSGAIRDAVESGASRIVIIPYFLTLGLHLQRDLPALVQAAQQTHPGVRIDVTPPLDGHPALASILLDRASTALDGSAA